MNVIETERLNLREVGEAEAGMELIVHRNPEAEAKGINPIDHGSSLHTQMWKTDGLRQALELYANVRPARSMEGVETRYSGIDLLIEGVTAIETVYRDILATPAPALNADQRLPAVNPRAAADALDACREAREAILINEKGIMRLTALVMALPPAAAH